MENFNLDIKATTPDGLEIPVKITVEYPDDQGLLAFQALRHAAENQGPQIMANLASVGDLSVLALLRENGLDLDDDGEE